MREANYPIFTVGAFLQILIKKSVPTCKSIRLEVKYPTLTGGASLRVPASSFGSAGLSDADCPGTLQGVQIQGSRSTWHYAIGTCLIAYPIVIVVAIALKFYNGIKSTATKLLK